MKESVLKMFNTTIPAIITCILTACGGGDHSASVVPPETIPIGETLEGTLDTYISGNLSDNAPGLSMLVRQNGVVVYQQNKGMANLNSNEVISAETGFRLASVAKSFTALALMQLYEQGLVNLDDRLGQYFPELEHNFGDVTIEQLLTHTSGIPDYFNDLDVSQRPMLNGLVNEEVIALFAQNAEPEFVPGSQAQYSNSGYLLIAQIVAKVSGMRFSDYMRADFFAPIGMSKSYILDGEFPLQQDDVLSFADRTTVEGIDGVSSGSSGQVSSINDLNLFLVALLNYDVVSEDTLNLMTQHHSTIPDVSNYGYGWQVLDQNNSIFQHRGGYGGFQTVLYIDQKNDLQVVVLTNGGFETSNHMLSLLQATINFYDF